MRALLLLALAAGAHAQQQQGASPSAPQTLVLPKHNGGAATFYSSNRIGPDQSPYILNGYLDADAAVVKRNGYQPYGTISGCTQPVTGGWPYTSLTGTYFFFVQCGGQIYETNGNGAFTVIGATISTVYPVRATASLGLEWFTDGVDQLWSTDGVTVSSYAAAPYAQLIGTFQNRIVLSNITGGPGGSGFTAAQSGTWLSGYQVGSDYALPAVIVDTSAAFFPLNGSNDTRQVTCEFDGYKSVQLLWNNGQMWGLYGAGNSSFVVQLISNEVGCTEQNSVQEYNGKLYWLSKRGIESFDGSAINMVSWPIQDQVQNLIVLQKSSQQNIQTSQGDWQAGNLTASGPGAPLSATFFPGDVVPSSSTFVNVSSADFVAGATTTTVQVSTNAAGAVTSGALLINPGFNTGDFTGWTGSFLTSGAVANLASSIYACSTPFSGPSAMAFAGTGCVDTPGAATSSMTVSIINASNSAVLYTASYSDSYGGTLAACTTVAVDVSAMTPPLQIVLADNTNARTETSGIFYSSNAVGGLVNYSRRGVNPGAYCIVGSAHSVETLIDFYDPWYVKTSTFISSTWDTSFSTPVLANFSASLSSSASNALMLNQQTSDDGTTWATAASITQNTRLTDTHRYWRYNANFTNTVATQTATLNQVGPLVAETTGYYITQCIQPAAGITSWGAIQANTTPNGGSFTFWMSTATTCASAINPATNWTAQTINTTITVATAAAVAVRVLETITVATQTPHLLDLTLNYNSSVGRPALASTVYNKRYYLAYTTNTVTGAYNDHILSYDTNGTWTLFDDISASGLWTSNLKLYSGSSQSDGKVFLQDTGVVDNGNNFTFRFDTPDLDFGNFASVKDLNDWWTEAQGTTNSAAAANVSVNYFVDGGTTAYSAGTFSTYSPERGYLFPNGYFGLNGSPTKAHTLRLSYQDTSSSPLRLYQTALRYWAESLP